MLSTILFIKKLHNGNILNKSIKKIKTRIPAYYGCSLNTTTYKSSKSYPFLSFTNKVVCDMYIESELFKVIYSSILTTATGQSVWWRMKSLVLPRMVLLIIPIPLLPVTTHVTFSLFAMSTMVCSGLLSDFSTRTSASI